MATQNSSLLPALDIGPFITSRDDQLRGWKAILNANGHWERPPREWWLYFIQGDDGGPIKIGATSRLMWRPIELQIGYPFGELRVVGLIRGPKRVEGEHHRRFRALRMVGEWFRPEPVLVDYVRSLPVPEVR